MATKKNTPLSVETLKHDDATRKNIPTAEFQAVVEKAQQHPTRVAFERPHRHQPHHAQRRATGTHVLEQRGIQGVPEPGKPFVLGFSKLRDPFRRNPSFREQVFDDKWRALTISARRL